MAPPDRLIPLRARTVWSVGDSVAHYHAFLGKWEKSWKNLEMKKMSSLSGF